MAEFKINYSARRMHPSPPTGGRTFRGFLYSLIDCDAVAPLRLSASYGDPVDTYHDINVIRGAHELGVTFFDTAESHGPYVNETLVGEASTQFVTR